MQHRLLSRWIIALEVGILAGIVIHAPLTVSLSVLWPQYGDLIRSWKEILMGICLVLLVIYVCKQARWHEVWSDWLLRLSALYGLLHIMLLAWQWNGLPAALSGLLIDLRYVLFFVLVYTTVKLIPTSRNVFLRVAIGGAVVVLGFALLQVSVLPVDVLKYLGYSKETIAPYLTVDLNHNYIRINSTLRGPNPLGAYSGICLALVVAYVAQQRNKLTKTKGLLLGMLAAGAGVALWASYSRSAVVAAIAMVLIAAVVAQVKRIRPLWWISGAVLLFGLIGGTIAARDTAFISNVVLHSNPSGGSAEKSDEGHVNSLRDGTTRMLHQPLGGGIGSTGSASLRSDQPLIIENQYLYVAHETGWIGLAVFLALFGSILAALWRRRSDWLALGLFAGGVGLAGIGLLLPVWADDTVAIVWWGLAAATIGGVYGQKSKSHKKTA